MTATPQLRIADVFRPSSRFFRSAQLERDFHDPQVFSGYVVTDFTRSCLNRLGEGLRPTSAQRAWRVTGDFGSGKSSFALLLAHWLAGHDRVLPKALWEVHNAPRRNRHFVPALVTCSKQPLSLSIIKALHGALALDVRIAKQAKLKAEVEKLLKSPGTATDDAVVDLTLKVSTAIAASSSSKGLLLIIDELGKFLEFAATSAETQDVFLLQRIAELASRSGKQPLFVVCLLHQGFGEYANNLSQVAQHEWEKVAGRFEQIIFDQPLDQVAELISSALNVQTRLIPRAKALEIKKAMSQAVDLGWFGAATSKKLQAIAVELYPLHPLLLPVLVRIFRRFGQNERSLFSFLFSNEPFGLQAFSADRIDKSQLYSLHNFYDYVRTNFGHRLSIQSYRSHWNLIDSVVDSYATDDELQLKLLKTIGLLNLVNDSDLTASTQSITCSTLGLENPQQIHSALAQLHKTKRALYDRGRAGGYCLWPNTSVDLEQAYREAGRAVRRSKSIAGSINSYLQTRPIVARRHYIETGNLRHYAVTYCHVSQLTSLLVDVDESSADGRIIIPLCETLADRSIALRFARSSKVMALQAWLVGIPQPLNTIANLVQEVQRWEWVGEHTLELNADRYAREEVSRQKQVARAQLETRLQTLIGIKQFVGQTSLEWFHKGRRVIIRDGRQLLSRLSRIMDEVFSAAPHVQNELVNRRGLSSAAAGARMRLVEAIFTSSTLPFLGMNPAKKPPEMSMYLSVLKHTGVHRQQDQSWRIREPHHRADRTNLLPALRRIREIVERESDARINIAVLFEELRKPPYGVRDGIIPLLLAIFALAHEGDVAFYKEGTFLRGMNGQSMLVLTKSPEKFEIQYCKIVGVRPILFEKLIAALKLKRSNKKRVELLDVVKPLCEFVAKLPSYVINTKRVSKTALDVRSAILNAREPGKLIFTSLPAACGYDSFLPTQSNAGQIPAFVASLKVAIDELRAAYPELQQRLRGRLREAFPLPGSFAQFRASLGHRAEYILLAITEPKLKSFCLRLSDDNLPESDWLESLGSYLALKPPSKWRDAEEDTFNTQLAELASRFHRVEAIAFAGGKASKDTIGVRLAITQLNGMEHEEVVHFTRDEEDSLLNLQERFENLLTDNKRLGLAAASRALWKSLGNGNKPAHD
ncbi:MAG: hypothetical protein AABN95_23705 [Acidobacteriota bacterium]